VFEDRRSKRVIFVSHCILNQNAKIDACARYPGVMNEVLEVIQAAGCGIVQLECPELMHLGLDRQADPEEPRSIESEDTRVAELMQRPFARICCREIADRAAYQVEQYLCHGFTVAGVLGIDGSPTCGVERGWSAGRETAGPGVLTRELIDACAQRRLSIPIRGIRAANPQEAVAVVRGMLGDFS
jgi:predicted secreted protein